MVGYLNVIELAGKVFRERTREASAAPAASFKPLTRTSPLQRTFRSIATNPAIRVTEIPESLKVMYVDLQVDP